MRAAGHAEVGRQIKWIGKSLKRYMYRVQHGVLAKSDSDKRRVNVPVERRSSVSDHYDECCSHTTVVAVQLKLLS